MFRLVTTVPRMDTPEALARRVAHVVKTAAEEAGISQRKLAEVTGIPLVTLGRRLNGGKSFEIRELAAIGEALDLSLTDIALMAERAPSPTA